MTTEAHEVRLSTVQALRGIAASLVVFFHFAHLSEAGIPFSSQMRESGLGNLGACGVDIFFVISGFIIVYTMRRKAGREDALTFIAKRAVRIYPLYWFWTTLLLGLWVAGVGQRLQHWSMAYMGSSYLLIPYFNGLDCHPVLSQGWTLSFEVYFYLVFSCGVLLKLRSARLPFFAAAFATLALLSRYLPTTSGARYLLENPILVEFLFGALAGELITRLPALSKHRWAHKASLVLISLGVIGLLGTIRLQDVSAMRFAFYGIPAFCIVFGAALLGRVSAPRLLVSLGDCSYSIYITHAFFLMLFRFAFKHFTLSSIFAIDTAIVLGATMTIALSALTYFLVERPLTRMVSNRAAIMTGRRRLSPVSFASNLAEASVHSALRTVENSSRPTVVKITS